MPYKPQKPCRQPGCPNLTYKTYCAQHIKANRRESAYERGYNHKWQKLRKQFLKRYPLCEVCKQNRKYVKATVVDHITPHRGDNAMLWDQTNWQSLCKRCHDRKTGTHESTPTYGY